MGARGPLTQDPVSRFRNILDLHTGHSAIVAPLAPQCKYLLPRYGLLPGRPMAQQEDGVGTAVHDVTGVQKTAGCRTGGSNDYDSPGDTDRRVPAIPMGRGA